MNRLRPYNDPDYRAARAWLTANPSTMCYFTGCNRVATTIDHNPAVAQHHHIRNSGCCSLNPACGPHNFSHGAMIGNMKRSSSFDW